MTLTKPLICYHCALRMSTMFCVPPPPSRQVVLSSSSTSVDGSPVLQRDVNDVFDVIYETEASSLRVLLLASPSPAGEEGRPHRIPRLVANHVFEFIGSNGEPSQLFQHIGKPLLTHPPLAAPARAHSAEEPTLTPPPVASPSSICVACCGLYQFLEEIYAPVAAALVRTSPYLDSTEIATNINCPRSMAFVWLACAVEFRRGVHVVVSGNGGASAVATAEGTAAESAEEDVAAKHVPSALLTPSPSAIIPEEFSNFRDFYMGDARNRILRFLTSEGTGEGGVAAPSNEIPGAALYRSILEGVVARRSSAAAVEETSRKRPREEDAKGVSSSPVAAPPLPPALAVPQFRDYNIPHLCRQALRFAALGTNGISIDLDATLPECYEYLALPERFSGVVQKGSTNRGGFESVVPTQYGSNKSGAVMMYSIVYDYVLPYMKKHSLGPFSARTEGASTAAELRCGVVLNVTHSNVFLIGLYRKMLRSLSQSPWFCEGQRIGSYSLQELIAEPFLRAAYPYGIPPGVLPTNASRRQDRAAEYLSHLTAEEAEQHQHRSTAGAAHRGGHQSNSAAVQEKDPFETSLENVVGYGWYKFHSAGREDVDVRMLGTGRPYVLELVAPHRQTFSEGELAALEAEVNDCVSGGVETEAIRYTTTDITVQLARHSESKTKTYRCVVWCSRAIASDADELLVRTNALTDVSVSQRTPLRVLHRRSLLDRPKIIHAISCQRVNDHWLVVDLETQAGTYVKEFIHGDNGRTSPSLGELLGGRTDIIQLDVLGMTLPQEMMTGGTAAPASQ